jgi:hypothetical protein
MDTASDRLTRSPGYAEADEEFWQSLVWAEEDRHLFTTAKWKGGYRWFRSPNVVCFEKYQRRRHLVKP